MLKVNMKYEKNAVSPKNKDGAILLEVNVTKGDTVKVARKKLNLSLAIDVSISMSDNLSKKQYNGNDFFGRGMIGHAQILQDKQVYINQLQGNQETNMYSNISKLVQAKKMASKIVEDLEDGDILSITTFSNVGKVIQEAKVITEASKALILAKINNLSVEGNTNLYEGWELSAREVAKYVSSKTLNRVILLTDGVVNQGLRDSNITSRIEAMTKANIQTSAIGIGEGFQEDLLSTIAEKGEGNFFFIEKDEDFSTIINTEMSGLTDAALTNVEVVFTGKNTDFKQLNGFKEDGEVIKIPNLRGSKTTELMVEFSVKDKITTPAKNKGFPPKIELGHIEITGLDGNGNKISYSQEISIQKVSDSDWEVMPANGDVTLKKVMMNVALDQQKASDMILKGQVTEARTLMASSAKMLKEDYSGSVIATAMANSIEGSLLKDNNSMSKTMRSASYSSRYGLMGDDDNS